jgi:hypothetical protein
MSSFLLSMGFYGLTAGAVARWLGLSEANPQGPLIVGADPLGREVARFLHAQGFRVLLLDHRPAQIAAARPDGLPTSEDVVDPQPGESVVSLVNDL